MRSYQSGLSGNSGARTVLKLGVSALALSALFAGQAMAQEDTVETVTVTGYRASLESALNVKRTSAQMVDAINAEDIAAFPDANLAESLQRLPGVSVDRDNGEGRTITVRGLNADFTRVTLNGMEALSTAGASASGDDPNRSRQFDFNTFASELFSGLKVYKSPGAETDEGSLGATVALSTGRPFDVGNKIVVSALNGTYEYGKGFNPRVAALVSHNFLGGRLGVLASIAYNMRGQSSDSYKNSISSSNYIYRSMVFKGSSTPARYGFASDYAADSTDGCPKSSTGTIPANAIAYYPYCQALQGSNSDAYAAVEGTGISTDGTAMSTILPALPTLNHQVLYQTRIGGTFAVQWQPTDKTMVAFDGVMSSTYQKSTNYQLTPIGLNRNNTSSNIRKLYADSTGYGLSTSSSRIASNTTYVMKGFQDAGDKCYNVDASTAAAYGVAEVSCLTDDANGYDAGNDNYAYNTSPYNYYTNYGSDLASGVNAYISFLGRPSTKLVSAHVKSVAAGSVTAQGVTTGVVDQMTLANVDFSSRADQAHYTTQFMQGTLAVEHTFNDRLRLNALAGMSVSRNHQVGYLVEFNKMDSGECTVDGVTYGSDATGAGCFVYDATGGGAMPYMDYGFDVADSSYWGLVKGYSNFKHYVTNTVNKFRAYKADIAYDVSDMFTVKVGFDGRIYDFDTTKFARVYKDSYGMPSMSELQSKYGSSFGINDLGRQVSWGTGLDVPSGMSVSGWYAPDIEKFKTYIFDHPEDFGYIDTISNKFSAASTSVTGNTYDVHEHDKSGYVQVDFRDLQVLGRALRGNLGMRFSTTSVQSNGHGTVGNDLHDSNWYTNFLPSVNLVYALTDNMVLRGSAAKVIARPQLSAMAPSITSFSIDSTMSGGSSLTIGNTKLKPYSANTFDIGYEWYFDEGAVFAVTGFTKFIKNVPQQVTTSGYLNEFMDQDSFNFLWSVYQGVPGMASSDSATALECSYNQTDEGCKFSVTTYANSRGGVLNGLEFTYQQVLSFLPKPFDGLGINANYTLLHSRMHYIISPETSEGAGDAKTGDGPWTGASPNSYNLTVFYDGKDWEDRDWSGRVSIAYRSKYVYNYPISSGSSVPGASVSSSSIIINDFEYTKSTLHVDTSFTYDYTKNLQFKVQALNLTNETSQRFAFQGAPMTTQYAASGRQIFVGLRFKY